jgi:hypothetical protein
MEENYHALIEELPALLPGGLAEDHRNLSQGSLSLGWDSDTCWKHYCIKRLRELRQEKYCSVTKITIPNKYKLLIIYKKKTYFVSRQVPSKSWRSQFTDWGYDNVLPGQGYSTSQGELVGEYVLIVEWWLERENWKKKLRENTNLLPLHPPH